MSASGSVIVMSGLLSRRGFSGVSAARTSRREIYGGWALPAALGDAGELARVGHLPEAHPAQTELAVDRVRPAAPLASGVATHLELGLARGLVDECCLGHGQASLKGNPSWRSRARPSSSVLAVVTTVMSMPRTRSILSWSTSWNIDCSLRPKV